MESRDASSASNRAGASSKKDKILLNILSPSPEVPQKLTYSEIPISTTISELKRKIQNDVETKPSAERQRLIYRGRPLVQGERSLEQVFGTEAIESSDVFSLHLVLPPLPSNPLPHHIPIQSGHTIPTPLTSERPPDFDFRSTRILDTPIPPRPASTGQLPQGVAVPHGLPTGHVRGFGGLPHQAQLPLQQFPFHPGQVPASMQDLMNAHFAALGQQQGFQIGHGGLAQNIGAPLGPNQPMGPQQPTPYPQFSLFPQPNFQHILAQQQQARAAAGQHGIGNAEQVQASAGQPTPPAQQGEDASVGTGPPNLTSTPGTSSTVVREGQTANGGQWRLVINQTTTQINPLNNNRQTSHVPQQSILATNQPLAVPNPHVAQPQLGPLLNADHQLSTPAPSNFWPTNPLALLYQRLSQLEGSLDHGNAPTETEINATRAQLQNYLVLQPSHAGLGPPLSARINNIALRAAQLRNSRSGLTGIPAVNTATPPIPTNISTNSVVYLLSSPSGPHGILISPSGAYGTPSVSAGTVNAVNSVAAQYPMATPVQPPNEQQAPAGQERQGELQAQQPDQANELLRVLLPLGGHLWLLIRLFGFVYFFTSGAGWYRTMLLGLCALLVFIAQTGVFRPLQQAIWDPVRQHIEGLVPLAVNDANAGVNGAPAQVNAQRAAGSVPSPQEVANRLLQERAAADGGLMRRNVRRLERAVALFLASLVPGVGERHVAAREAADAARLAAEREREDQARREEELRAEEQRQHSEGDENGEGDTFTDAEDGEPSGNEHEKSTQQPLVEI